MGTRLTPTEIASNYAALNAINENFTEIANMLDRLLLRDGTEANSMDRDVDMNHYAIHNVATAVADTDAINLVQAKGLIGSAATGPQGNPGGNVMSVGLFTSLPTMTIPLGTDVIRTSGYYTEDKGAAFYVYSSSVNSAYVSAHPYVSFIDAGGRGFKLSMDQVHNWYMFGLYADDDTGTPHNDFAAWTAMLAWMQLQIKTGGAIFQYGVGAAKPIYCFGAAYMGGSVSNIDWAANLQGFGQGVPGASPSQLRWDDNTCGIVLGIDKNQHADGYRFEGFTLKGGFTDIESESHALQWHSKGIRRNLQIYNWGGDGMVGNNDSGTTGNSNGDVTDKVFIQGCRRGHYINGADTNGGLYNGIDAENNRQCGIWSGNDLGSHYRQFLLEGNARMPWNSGVDANHPASYCYLNGHNYVCVVGQETWCQTNAPTGTTNSNQGWAYWQDAGAASPTTGVPAWNTGMYWRSGGGIIHQGLSSFCTFSGYVENDECCQFDQYAKVDWLIGTHVANLFSVHNGNLIYSTIAGSTILQRPNGFSSVSGGVVRCLNNLAVGGLLTLESGSGFMFDATTREGIATTVPSDIVVSFKNNNVFSELSFLKSDGTQDGYLQSTSNGVMYLNHKTGVNLRVAGVDIVDIDSTGANIQSGKVLKVAGSQVVTSRKTGWSTDTGVANRGSLATYTAGTGLTYSATYTQSEQTATGTRIAAIETALQNLSQAMKALKDDLHATAGHGLIGT